MQTPKGKSQESTPQTLLNNRDRDYIWNLAPLGNIIVLEEKLDWKPNLRTVNIKTFGGECDLRDTTKVDCQVRGVTSASQYYKGSQNQTRHRPKKCLTFTSPVVWRKHVTQRTRTPEWTKQVYTEMGANTWVSSTFINIWIRNITEMLWGSTHWNPKAHLRVN